MIEPCIGKTRKQNESFDFFTIRPRVPRSSYNAFQLSTHVCADNYWYFLCIVLFSTCQPNRPPTVYTLMGNGKKKWISKKLGLSLALVFVGAALSRIAWLYIQEPIGAILIIAGAAFIIASLIVFAIYFSEY